MKAIKHTPLMAEQVKDIILSIKTEEEAGAFLERMIAQSMNDLGVDRAEAIGIQCSNFHYYLTRYGGSWEAFRPARRRALAEIGREY